MLWSAVRVGIQASKPWFQQVLSLPKTLSLSASHKDLFSSSHHRVDHHAHWADFGVFFFSVFQIDLGWMSKEPPFFWPPLSLSGEEGDGWKATKYLSSCPSGTVCRFCGREQFGFVWKTGMSTQLIFFRWGAIWNLKSAIL
jgi:hypothetical protein